MDDSFNWYINRYVSVSHALSSNLKKGNWHDLSERMLHCPMDELVDFVEIESAWMHIAWDDERAKNYPKRSFFGLKKWRSPEAGLDHIKWEMSLVYDEEMGCSKDNKDYGKPTGQAKNAKIIFDLYNWWKFTRPARPDPHEVSGWSEYCSSKKGTGLFARAKTPEEKKKVSAMLKQMDMIEAKYEKEDTDMLCLLMKNRKGLWT